MGEEKKDEKSGWVKKGDGERVRLCELSRTWMGMYLHTQPGGIVGDLTAKSSLLCRISALHRAGSRE